MWNPLPTVTTAVISQNYGAATGLLTVTGTGFVAGAQIQAAGGTAHHNYTGVMAKNLGMWS